MSIIIETPVSLPHPALPLGDWADRYETSLIAPGLTAREAAQHMLTASPRWVNDLMWLRDQIVGPLGLKTLESAKNIQSKIGMFPVLKETPSRVIMGMDDRHLDFRIIVDVENRGNEKQTVSLSTIIQRKNTFGRFYLFVITPFHRRIVRAGLKKLHR